MKQLLPNQDTKIKSPDVGLCSNPLQLLHPRQSHHNLQEVVCPLSCDPELCSCTNNDNTDNIGACAREFSDICSGQKVGTDGYGNPDVTFTIDQCVGDYGVGSMRRYIVSITDVLIRAELM